MERDINRIKVVLVEQTLMQIAKCLDVEVYELLHPVDKVVSVQKKGQIIE